MSITISDLKTDPNLSYLNIAEKEKLIDKIKNMLSENKNDIAEAAVRIIPILVSTGKLDKIHSVLDSSSMAVATNIAILLSSKRMLDSDHLDEMIEMVKSSKKEDNTFLAVKVSCFPAVINSKDFTGIVNLFLTVKNVGQVYEAMEFLSRHKEKTNNPDYVTNIDTLKILLSSENNDQALYRSLLATYLTNEGLSPEEMHKFMNLVQKEHSYNHYKSLAGIHSKMDEISAIRLIEEIGTVKEPYKIDYILQYASDFNRSDSDEKLKLLADFIKTISAVEDKTAAENIYRARLRSLYEIPSSADTLEYPWGTINIIGYEIDQRIISRNTTLDGETLLPGSVVIARLKKNTIPKMKKKPPKNKS